MSIRHIGLLPQVAAAHLVSHLHIMALPALFPLLPALFGVGYVELGLALSLFNIVTALVQAPMGFAVDHYGARRMLIGGVALGSIGFLLIALFPTYTGLLIAMTLAGVANAVYHPADYALLSRGIDPAHIGKAYSVHTFAGFLGAAIAPAFLLGIATASEPRLAFVGAALVGLAVLGLLLVPGSGLARIALVNAAPEPAGSTGGTRLRSLLSPMILTLTMLFVLLNLSTSAIEKFSVAALMQGQGATLPWANSALTAFLFASAFGVLSGGVLADRTQRHGLVAASAFALAAVLTAIVATAHLSELALTIVLGPDRADCTFARHAGPRGLAQRGRRQNLRHRLHRLQHRRRDWPGRLRLDAGPGAPQCHLLGLGSVHEPDRHPGAGTGALPDPTSYKPNPRAPQPGNSSKRPHDTGIDR